MAQMFYITGKALNEKRTTSGRYKENAKFSVETDTRALENKIYHRVMQMIETGAVDTRKARMANPSTGSMRPSKKPTNASSGGKSLKEEKAWEVSLLGNAMLMTNITNSMISLNNTYASTDQSAIESQLYTSTKGAATIALGASGFWGAMAAMGIHFVDSLVGQYIKNQIQLKYDDARLAYNISHNNYGKYSTYTYDYSTDSWKAIDNARATKALLNQTNIS